MDFITLQDVKDFEGLRSPDQDAPIQILVDAVNSQFTTILDADNNTAYLEKMTSDSMFIFLDTDALAKDIAIVDEADNPLTGFTGVGGSYILNNPYSGILKFTLPNPFATVPPDLKMAALYLVRHYRKDEYKSSESGSGQAVSYVSLSSNIPKHVMSVLSLYRPI